MGFLDKAKEAAEQAADLANETITELQTKRDLSKAYGELGKTAFKLADAGTISHPEIEAQIARIRDLQAKLDEAHTAGEPAPTEAVEQPMSGAGPGAA